jgi:PKD repeat protein
VTLTVTDAEGAKGTSKTQITIQNKAPSANAGADRIVNEDDVVNFNAGGSTDTASDVNSLTYHWDFGDGTTGNGIIASHKYAEKGIYTTTLRVTDDDGESDVDDAVVTVTNVVPAANAGPDQTVREGQTVLFDGAGTTDTPTDKTILDYSWSFGGQGINPTYVWSDDGVKGVSLTATDNDAASNADGMNVNVQNVAPSVGINALAVSDTTSVNFTLRSAGEKWRDVRLYLHEDNVLIRELAVYRNPGSPDNQSDTAYGVILDFGKTYNVSVFFTPADDPVNGQPQGDSPSWIILGLEDGRQFWIQHNFNVNQPDTYRWDVDFSSIVKVTPRAAALDPGSDDVTLNWNFGDAQSPIVSHYYANYGKYPMYVNDSAIHVYVWPGSYAVILTAVDDDGGSNSHTVQLSNQPSSVTIDNYAPIATAGNNQVANEDSTVSFGGSAADDPADVLSYLWDFGDDSFATGVNAIHVYRYAGTYLVILTVTDNHGAVDQDALFVIIDNIAPISEAGGDQAINEDGTAVFSGSQSIDTASDKPLLTYLWDFGDGTFGNGIGTSHVYTKVGTYTVTLMVTDNDGASDTDSLTVSVSNVAPTANAGPSQSANEDQVVMFSGTATDTPTDWQILSYSWTFGGGGIGHGKNPTHSYVNAGTYSVALVVTDDNGATATSSLQVIVSNVVPVVYMSGYPATAKLIWAEAVHYQFDASAIDTFSDQNLLTYDWDLGDGNTASAPSPSHMYTASGTYLVTLIVTDNEGASVTSSLTIDVILDSDGDILRDEDEIGVYHTDPFRYDTDGDWLTDYTEVTDVVDSQGRHTDPTKADSDSDGLNDWEERYSGEDHFITDPFNPDTDGDGLIDSQEMFTKVFRTTDRFKITDCTSSSAGMTDVSLSGVYIAVPYDYLVYKVDVKIGLTHDNISNLGIELIGAGKDVGLRSWNFVAVGDTKLYTNYSLLDRSEFSGGMFNQKHTWTLRIWDFKADGSNGFVEYFEVHLTGRTYPTLSDYDGDLVNDYEEINPGNDGWITEPYVRYTDGDGWDDGYETKVKFTDPTRADTDRDGAIDSNDIDPLHNVMVKITIVSFTAYDNDPGLDDSDPEPFIGITYRGETFYTNHLDPSGKVATFNNVYMLDADDNKSVPFVLIISAWDDDPISDFEWNIQKSLGKRYVVNPLFYPESDISWTYVTRSSSTDYDDYDVNNSYDGGYLASATFELETIKNIGRIKTIFLNSTDGESLYLAQNNPNGNEWRYHGENKFYAAILYATSSSGSFSAGYNAIIIPRTIFMKSQLNDSLRSSSNGSNLPTYLQNLEFGEYDDTKSVTTGSVVGTLTGTVTGTEAQNILDMLTFDTNGNRISQNRIVTDQLVTLNIDDDVLKLIPLTGISFGPTGDEPSNILNDLVKVIINIGNIVWNALVAIYDFFSQLAQAIADWGMKIIGAIIDFFSAVIDAIIKIAEAVVDFISWILSFVESIIKGAINAIIQPILNAMGDFLNDLCQALSIGRSEYISNSLNSNSASRITSILFGTLFWAFFAISAAIVLVTIVLSCIPLIALIMAIVAPIILTCLLLAMTNDTTTSSHDLSFLYSIPITSPDAIITASVAHIQGETQLSQDDMTTLDYLKQLGVAFGLLGTIASAFLLVISFDQTGILSTIVILSVAMWVMSTVAKLLSWSGNYDRTQKVTICFLFAIIAGLTAALGFFNLATMTVKLPIVFAAYFKNLYTGFSIIFASCSYVNSLAMMLSL